MSGCHINRVGEYLFIGQEKKENSEPFEQSKITQIFYRNGSWESRLACKDIELYGNYVTQPDKASLSVTFLGMVLRVDKNGRVWEDDVPVHPDLENEFISKTKVIAGSLYTVSDWRVVKRRDGINQWTILGSGLPDLSTIDSDTEEGFDDIDGFSENDIYATGLNADIWHWNGKIWNPIEIPTNADIICICCGGDGLVYLNTNVSTFIIGRNNRWKTIKYDNGIKFYNMVWFRDRIYMGHGVKLYEIKDGMFNESILNEISGKPADVSFIDATDEIMLLGSKIEVATYDGNTFTNIIPFNLGGEQR